MAYTTLVSTKILEDNLQKPNWVIFDCRSSLLDHEAGLKAYQTGHIPMAHYCHLENDLSSPITETSGRHPLPDFDALIKKLGDWGVNKETQVVAYDDAGGAYAVRLWWQLRTFGHDKVAVLDGGINQWEREDKLLTQELPSVNQTIFTPNINKNEWITTQQMEQNQQDKKFIVLDARTPERYRGESEPIDTVAGRIPNSLNHAFQLNLDESGLFLSEEALRQRYQAVFDQSIGADASNIVHLCGSGVTACHNMLAMEIAGFKGSKLYVGSWSEWIRDNKRPIATG